MSEENKVFELNDKDLEKVSGGVDSSWAQLSSYEYNQYYCDSHDFASSRDREACVLPACQNCSHCTTIYGTSTNYYCTLGKHPNINKIC